MRLISILACCCCLLIPCATRAVELQKSPVRDAMLASMSGDTWRTGEDTSPGKGEKKNEAPRSTVVSGNKSVVKAAALSALVPGGGQYYNGHRKKARYFFVAEALTWLGYVSFKTYSNWKEEDYVNFAATHANAQLDGKSDEFIAYVGFYDNIRDYNDFGRAFDPEREYLFDTPENHWEWQSYEDRKAFREIKNRSREADRRADFMIGVAVVDRIISIIDAVRDARRDSRRLDPEFSGSEGTSFRFSVNPFKSGRQVSLTLYSNLLP